jgi:hypothetical protein
MASKLIQFRLSGEELEALEAQVREGDSINLVAQRILIGALGVDTVDEVSTVPLDERIEGIVEERLSAFSTNCNDLFDRLQGSIQSLQERIQTLETQAIALPPTSLVENKPIVDSLVDTCVDSVDLTLTGKELAQRLEVHPATLTKNRAKETFTDWTRGRDPEGKAWRYLPEVERYSPMLSTEVSTQSTEDDNFAG